MPNRPRLRSTQDCDTLVDVSFASLDPNPLSLAPIERLVLTGFMGSGKSTVGPHLAKRLGWRYRDADAVLEAQAKATVAEIFARHGEAHFRQLEQATIARLLDSGSLVLALGGGAIEQTSTRELLLHRPGTVLIHLAVSLETALQRCRGSEATRPVLADRARLAERYQRRLPLYNQAPLTVAVDHLTPAQVAAQIHKEIERIRPLAR